MKIDEFVQRLQKTSLVQAGEIRTLIDAETETPEDAKDLARLLVARGQLTVYQARQIINGKEQSLVLGNYVVIDKLGQGGMGVVLKARHRRMDRLVALKILSPAATRTPEAIRRFQREVEAAARLDHPNIVTAFDADEADGTHFLVMQFVDGSDLARVVRKSGPLSLERALRYTVQTARGLAYAHSQGVVHRDIKPANLLVDRDDHIRILDMGLARLASRKPDQDQLTGTGQIMGTADYMAPEQARDTRAADERSDLYSLGATLWFLLTARPLFEGDTMVAKLLAHQQQRRPSLDTVRPDLPPVIDHILERMLAKEPGDRFPDMNEAIAALEQLGSPTVTEMTTGEPRLDEFLQGLKTDATVGAQHTTDETIVERPPASKPDESDSSPPTRSSADDSSLSADWFRDRKRLFGIGGAVVLTVAVSAFLVSTAGRNEPPPPADDPVAPEQVAQAATPALGVLTAEKAAELQGRWAAQLDLPVQLQVPVGGEVMTLALIPPGEFLMGTMPADVNRIRKMAEETGEGWEVPFFASETPIHRVKLTRPFYIGIHEVTNAQFRAFTARKTIIWNSLGAPRHPATNVSYGMVDDFCEWLSEETDARFRLPTEAEWEYACRAGTRTHFAFGDSISPLQANFHGQYPFGDGEPGINRDAPTRVGDFLPNNFGLFDMHGNVWEICADGWDRSFYDRSPPEDPFCPDEGRGRVHRSGDYENSRGYSVRSSVRHTWNVPYPTVGFRVVREIADPSSDTLAEDQVSARAGS